MTPAKLDHRRAEVKSRSAEKGSSREQILEAATRVFAKRGYRDASIAEIAAGAGFSKGALYWNFKSKAELFFALLDRVEERLRVLLTLIASSPTDRDVTAELSRHLATLLEQNRDVVLVFHEYTALAVRDPALAKRYAERSASFRKAVASAIEGRFEALGVPLSMPAENLATVVMSLVIGLSVEQLTEPEAVSEDLFGRVLAVLEAGMAHEAGPEA
ncbi:MAG TPA: TetR/AcrR family transcriptional regulator [Solirubrobacterales bacterium]|nr:TetR/AcrR family transcriptional regulator [Solirubrobacterales bacterium]